MRPVTYHNVPDFDEFGLFVSKVTFSYTQRPRVECRMIRVSDNTCDALKIIKDITEDLDTPHILNLTERSGYHMLRVATVSQHSLLTRLERRTIAADRVDIASTL